MRYLSYPELKEKGIPWSRMHIDRLEKAGTFPKRRELGANTVGWDEEEIEEWLASRPIKAKAGAATPEPAIVGDP